MMKKRYVCPHCKGINEFPVCSCEESKREQEVQEQHWKLERDFKTAFENSSEYKKAFKRWKQKQHQKGFSYARKKS